MNVKLSLRAARRRSNPDLNVGLAKQEQNVYALRVRGGRPLFRAPALSQPWFLAPPLAAPTKIIKFESGVFLFFPFGGAP